MKGLADKYNHYGAICNYCGQKWSRGKLATMESHLALHCEKAPENISTMFLHLIAEKAERFFQNDSRLLDKELVVITVNINKSLINQHDLTLALDGWTNPFNNLLYNYFISIPDQKEYLIAIQDYSLDSQMGTYIADKISTIIEKIGSSKFAAIVTDDGSNVRVARQIINETYSQIMNIRCITYWFNLISSDLVEIPSIKLALANASMIITFFKKSHIASRLLRDEIKIMNIQGKNLEQFIKTRWVSAFNTADSLICIKPVFDKILEENHSTITNNTVYKLLKDDEEIFFSTCRHIITIF
ncbi:1989_t:CDS:2 [Acaulospora morrowiae]|uniref:1989_t:CDS:1 n=1 Tax=Acaulospora morrowiae TaxID=94023 RepID=A0A9N8YW96_9GLOM|nr:1989_t:CDS:2 [Acaulospora morrowiae]